jgi:hypothetical protein
LLVSRFTYHEETMSVLVRFGNRKAILRWGEWWSADKDLEAQLNHATSNWIRETGGPSLRDRDQEQSVALEMARLHDGRVALHVRSRSRMATQKFHEQRQMTLEFPSYSPANTRRGRRQPAAGSS